MERQVKDITVEKEVLQSRLTNEIIQRKKLHNIIEDLKGKIRVFCRIRPFSRWEEERNAK
jgi:kinesin family protein C1